MANITGDGTHTSYETSSKEGQVCLAFSYMHPRTDMLKTWIRYNDRPVADKLYVLWV